ncbi:MAG: hypothetical protein CMJ38_08895 [Phycisphaerae bacterium]|nr:hypothetical protein [Phycisphaerae bacterium]MBI70085.1 hypothetical protein [Phycisphaerae bacterium]
MTEQESSASQSVSMRFGAWLTQFIVPLWVFFGAFSKANGATAKSLPRSILDAGGIIGIKDHYIWLLVLLIIEFIFVGVMFFMPKLARSAATLLLSTFLLVLLVEMFGYGNYESCGCLGEHSLSPMMMFAIDFLLLLGIIIFKPKPMTCTLTNCKMGFVSFVIFIAITTWYSADRILTERNSSSGEVTTLNLPNSWYPQDLGSWDGKSVDDIELFSWVEWPEDIRVGKQYVIFYGMACDHCEELLYMHFEFDVQFPTTLVAIPESKDEFNEDGAFDNPCFDCIKTRLPLGVDWIIGTPMVIALEDGIVRCAIESEESEYPACLIW